MLWSIRPGPPRTIPRRNSYKRPVSERLNRFKVKLIQFLSQMWGRIYTTLAYGDFNPLIKLGVKGSQDNDEGLRGWQECSPYVAMKPHISK
jgi:hypothetical protein